jgi:hypothetical protein
MSSQSALAASAVQLAAAIPPPLRVGCLEACAVALPHLQLCSHSQPPPLVSSLLSAGYLSVLPLTAATTCLPPATCHLPPATCHLPPATCYLPPATCHLPPATCHLPPATCHLPPATCHLPPATCHLPPACRSTRGSSRTVTPRPGNTRTCRLRRTGAQRSSSTHLHPRWSRCWRGSRTPRQQQARGPRGAASQQQQARVSWPLVPPGCSCVLRTGTLPRGCSACTAACY